MLFDAVLFCFAHREPTYRPSPGAEPFLREYVGQRFPTVPMLEQGWMRCLEETKGRGIVTPEQEIVDDAQAYEDGTLAEIK